MAGGEKQYLIHFDGWSNNYDYYAPITDEDLHPAGYCDTIKRKLEIPNKYGKNFVWSTYLKEQQAEMVHMPTFGRSCRTSHLALSAFLSFFHDSPELLVLILFL